MTSWNTLRRGETDIGATGGNHPEDTWKNAYYLSTSIDGRMY